MKKNIATRKIFLVFSILGGFFFSSLTRFQGLNSPGQALSLLDETKQEEVLADSAVQIVKQARQV